MPFEILDSDDSGGDGFDEPAPTSEAPTSEEVRQHAIDAARLIIAPSESETPVNAEYEGQSGGAWVEGEYEGVAVDAQEEIVADAGGEEGAAPIGEEIAERIWTEADGGDGQAYGDVYNPPEDDDEARDVLPPLEKKPRGSSKRSTPSERKRSQTAGGDDSDNDYGASRKKRTRKSKSRSNTPIVIYDSDGPPTAATKKQRAKPERKRDLARELQDFLPLPSPQFAVEIQKGQGQTPSELLDFDGLGVTESPMSTIPDPPELWAGLGIGEVGGGVDSDSGGGLRIASEWRAAKAKGRQNLSDKPVRQSPAPVTDGNAGRKSRKPTPKRPAKERKFQEQDEDLTLHGTENYPPTTKEQAVMEPAPAPITRVIADTDDDMEALLSSPPMSPVKPLRGMESKPGNGDDEYGDSISLAPAPGPAKRKRTPAKKVDAPVADGDDGDGDEWNGGKPKAVSNGRRTKSTEKARSRPEVNEEELETLERDAEPVAEAVEDFAATLEPEPVPSMPKSMSKRKREKTADPSTLPGDSYPPKKTKIESSPPASVDETPGTPAPPPLSPDSSKKKQQQHSPLKSGKVPYRVGLSKRARIEPLLSVRPREKKRDA